MQTNVKHMQQTKIKVFMLTALITIFTASAMSQAQMEGITDSETDPTGEIQINTEFKNKAQLVFSADSESLAAPVDNVESVIQPEDGEEIEHEAEKAEEGCPGYNEDGSLETGCLYNSIIDVEEYGSGSYTVKGGVEYRFLEETSYTNEYEILLDNQDPEVTERTPEEGINPNQGINVSITFNDIHSNIKNTSLKIENNGETLASKTSENNEISINIPSNELENRNRYKAKYTATDRLNNTLNSSWSFYTETNYYGDRNPEIPDSGPIKWATSQDNTEIQVNYSETEQNHEKFPVQLTCYDSNGNKISSNRQNLTEASKISDFSLSCQIPRNRFIDRNKEITFETCDAAGNCIENTTRTYTFDSNKPTMENIKLPAEQFAGKFKLEINAEDQTTQVEKIRYRYDQEKHRTSNYIDGTTVIQPPKSYPSVADTYQLKIQAVDGAGHRSSVSTIETDFISSKLGIQGSGDSTDNYDVNIDAESEYRMLSGEKRNISIEVENEGTTYISETAIQLKTEAFNNTQTLEYLAPGKSKQLNIRTQTSEYGLYNTEITGPNAETETSLIIEPTNQQKETIVNKHNLNQQKIEELQQKIEELEQKPINNEKINKIKSNFTKLNQIHGNNSQHIDNSNYYLTSQKMDEFQENASIIEERHKETINDYQNKRTRNLLILLLIGSGSLIMLLETFFAQSEEYDISFRDVEYIKIIKTHILMMEEKGPSITEKLQKIYSQHRPENLQKLVDKTRYRIKKLVRDDRFKEYEYEQ